MNSLCPTCEEVQEVEYADDTETLVVCLTCGDEFTPSDTSASIYENYAVGEVLSVETVPKKSDLKKCTIDVTGDGSSSVTVVTNAKHVAAGWRVVVALENAVVPAGANPEEDSDVVVVKKASVGGVKSEGMLCDSPMLGWTGGAKGAVQQVPEEFPVGGPPPASRPGGVANK